MPHKHKRKRGDESDFDLPPSQRARPLPTQPANRLSSHSSTKSKKRNKNRSSADDAPRAFRRLMAVAQGKKFRPGLDDGNTQKAAPSADTAIEAPRIRPGEDLRSYAQRVDAALPVAGLTKKTVIKDGKDEIGLKVHRTRKERKMHKLYDQWRAEDRKIKDQREEELEEAAQREIEDDAAGIAPIPVDDGQGSSKKKKSKRRGGGGDDDDDPWLQLKKQRAEAKVGLHDVAQAPPSLNKKKLRPLTAVRGAAVAVDNVPKAAGSLRRREELQAVRDDVVEAYRRSIANLVTDIQKSSAAPGGLVSKPRDDEQQNNGKKPGFDDRATGIIYGWLVERDDVSVGHHREFNHLSLQEVLALSQSQCSPNQRNEGANGNTDQMAVDAEAMSNANISTAPPTTDVRVYTSEQTMWESICGHTIDFKRVPKSEWILLLGIASTRKEGILQGDLGRLVDQDKRSVPKRTDALVTKGYIVKRTTLVRRTKTSKLWLNAFAPPLPKEAGSLTNDSGIEMNLSRQVLLANLDAVPWHSRWTGESMDYIALATTIMALSKEWGVLRILDLKHKLGVIGMRWQMKVVAKICRFLNSRGAAQFVAAKLDDKVYKDCIKYTRDLTPRDWATFLATGKRTSRIFRTVESNADDEAEGLEQEGVSDINVSYLNATPPWALDQPLPAYVVQSVASFGPKGLSNSDLYSLTLGTSFSRFFSSMTTVLSTSDLQPRHLSHMQLGSEHVRIGKVASYRYFIRQNDPASSNDLNGASEPRLSRERGESGMYGFTPATQAAQTSLDGPTLSDLCAGIHARWRPGGSIRRVKTPSMKPQPSRKLRDPLSVVAGKASADSEASGPQNERPSSAPVATETGTDTEVPVHQDETLQNAPTPDSVTNVVEASVLQDERPDGVLSPEASAGTEVPVLQNERLRIALSPKAGTDMEALAPQHGKPSFMVTLKVSPRSLQDCLARDLPSTPGIPDLPERPSRSTTPITFDHLAAISHIDPVPDQDPTATEGLDTELTTNDTPETSDRGRGRGRGRGRARGRGRGRGRGRRSGGLNEFATTVPRQYTCEKCGGTWKNDIGLKYHVEKSQTPCNPSFDPSTKREPRARTRTGVPKEILVEDSHDLEAEGASSNPTKEFSGADAQAPGHSQSCRGGKESNKNQTEESSDDENDENEEENPSRPSTLTWRRPPTQHMAQTVQSYAIRINQGHLLSGIASRPRQLFPRQRGTSFQQDSATPLATPVQLDSIQHQIPPDPTELSHDLNDFSQYSYSCEPQESTRTPLAQIVDEDLSQPDGALAISQPTGNLQETRGTESEEKRKPPSRAEIRALIVDVVNSILLRHDGLTAGESALWQAFLEEWYACRPGEKAPASKVFKAALGWMVEHGVVAEHWHGFRKRDGTFSRCQIITWPDMDAFSPECLRLVEYIKEEDSLLVPDAEDDPSSVQMTVRGRRAAVRGRRPLMKEVATLSAPVYTAQLAAKKADDVATGESPRGRRKTRQRVSLLDEYRNTFRRDPTLEDVSQARKQPDGDFDQVLGASVKQPPSLGLSGEIRFLDPNTYLDEDYIEEEAPRSSPGAPEHSIFSMNGRRRLHEEQDGRGSRTDRELWLPKVDLPTNVITGVNGSWPSLDLGFFERLDSSHTVHGWMPDKHWFALYNDAYEIEKAAVVNRRNKKYSPNALSYANYRQFLGRLRACRKRELACSETFIRMFGQKSLFYDIFVDFRVLPGETFVHVPDLDWPEDGQLTLEKSTVLLAELDALAPSSSSDDEGEDDEDEANPSIPASSATRPRLTAASVKQGDRPMVDRVPLKTRALTQLGHLEEGVSAHPSSTSGDGGALENSTEVLTAFVVVRVLLGGTEKAVDWGLLLHIFPHLGMVALRKFWANAVKEQGPQIARLTQEFQDNFLAAYENDEIPVLDYDNPMEYDWLELIQWASQLSRHDGDGLPTSRELLTTRFTLQDNASTAEDWRERYFHVQTSVFARFEAATSEPSAISACEISKELQQDTRMEDVDVAASWIRSLCYTEDMRYSVWEIKERFNKLCERDRGDPKLQQEALPHAFEQLVQQRVICRIKKPPPGGLPYRLSEWYIGNLGKLVQRSKYAEAYTFKNSMDAAFRQGRPLRVPYTLTDGAMMALTNLNAYRRITLVPLGVPDIPFGFEPGNYESRKFPKSYYHFGIEAVPTDDYLYNDEIDALATSISEGLPAETSAGGLPRWIDLFGHENLRAWTDILAAFCFICATRGPLTVEAIGSALSPHLEPFEIRLIVQWGQKAGVLRDLDMGMGITVEEWWWLAVPWQDQRVTTKTKH
ncbi:hypothetical protein S40288_08227 [Stachybotrys chartarum IBT 40288]|nr:hypothetical protein S40288_08227 [Stachybotrys chartarum IBT 40288]